MTARGGGAGAGSRVVRVRVEDRTPAHSRLRAASCGPPTSSALRIRASRRARGKGGEGRPGGSPRAPSQRVPLPTRPLSAPVRLPSRESPSPPRARPPPLASPSSRVHLPARPPPRASPSPRVPLPARPPHCRARQRRGYDGAETASRPSGPPPPPLRAPALRALTPLRFCTPAGGGRSKWGRWRRQMGRGSHAHTPARTPPPRPPRPRLSGFPPTTTPPPSHSRPH